MEITETVVITMLAEFIKELKEIRQELEKIKKKLDMEIKEKDYIWKIAKKLSEKNSKL